MKSGIGSLLCGAMLLAGSAQADTLEAMKRNLDRYSPYLQGPVDEMEIRRWDDFAAWPIGPDKVLVRMWRGKTAYLLTVDTPCTRLPWATNIFFNRRPVETSAAMTVRKGVKVVITTTDGRDYCPITEIRSIDYARMMKDGQANRYR
ncbi:DUF6491 family protein [Dokdonella sp.]|uniref:DUF6491 family protein n=1 Tax=Dokdonella sp. TaxID=2291710 RepID=UPI001B00585E|nr:DUF6491 family protein [Dokdonella sp.]MBO9664939.1 hypothetical protein [Dokdonella sp.]